MGILIRPIITEKATADSEDKNRFAFEVAVDANKVEIRKAVEELYGVNVESVKTMVMPGKRKFRYTKQVLLVVTLVSIRKPLCRFAVVKLLTSIAKFNHGCT